MATRQVFVSSRQDPELNPLRDVMVEVAATPAFSPILHLWRFEDQPAGRDPELLYREAVEQSDLVLWIAGCHVSEATEQEIVHAAEHGVDIRGFVIPRANRDPRVTALIAVVRDRSKTVNVDADPATFRVAVEAALTTWICDRLAFEPTDRRIERLRALTRESRERTIRLFTGALVSRAIAEQLADDPTVGRLQPEMLPAEGANLRFIASTAGGGKSLALQRAHQEAIERAMESALSPAAIFLRAGSITGSLRTEIEVAIYGFGTIEFNGVHLALDDLDEIDEARASILIEEAIVIAAAHPRCRMLLASRIRPSERLGLDIVELPPLSDVSARALIVRVAGEAADTRFNHAAGAAREALRLPLFALIFSGGAVEDSSEAGMSRALLERGLPRTERRHLAEESLQRLAAEIFDSTEGSVPSERFSAGEQGDLVATRLVYEEVGRFRIPLRIVAEAAASGWLARQPRAAVMEKLSQPSVDRWLPALITFFRALEYREAQEFLAAATSRDFYVALKLAESDQQEPPEPWNQERFEAAIRETEVLFAAAFATLYERDNRIVTVIGDDDRLSVERTLYDDAGRLLVRDTYSGFIQNTRMAPFSFCVRVLSGMIDKALEDRGINEGAAMLEETLWDQGRVLLGRGSLSEDPLPLEDLEQRLERLPPNVVVVGDGGRHYQIAQALLRERINRLRATNHAEWAPSFVIGDADRGTWIWSRYSQDALMARRRRIVAESIPCYRAIVERWLAPIASRMQRYLLTPALLRERMEFHEPVGPVSSRYWLPLPAGSPDEHDLQMGEPFVFASIIPEIEDAVTRNRPTFAGRIRIGMANGIVRMWGSRPVRDETYRWLTEDLRILGLTKHAQLPRDNG